jgi:hypothetical protein
MERETDTVNIHTSFMKFSCKKKGRNGAGIWGQESLISLSFSLSLFVTKEIIAFVC